jgi:hypothetical protein
MMWHLLSQLRSEDAILVAIFAAAAVLAIGSAIVLLVKPVANKLILLGLLLAVTAILAGGALRTTALPIIMLILAVLIILAGVFCLVIECIVRLFKRPPADTNQSQHQQNP